MNNLDNDKLTTYIGLGGAVAVSIGNYIATGADVKNPMFWVLLVAAIGQGAHGYLTNKK